MCNFAPAFANQFGLFIITTWGTPQGNTHTHTLWRQSCLQRSLSKLVELGQIASGPLQSPPTRRSEPENRTVTESLTLSTYWLVGSWTTLVAVGGPMSLNRYTHIRSEGYPEPEMEDEGERDKSS